jgi:hypothetical protein
MSNGEHIRYTTKDRAAGVQPRAESGSTSAAHAEKIAVERYQGFEVQLREQLAADEQNGTVESEKIVDTKRQLRGERHDGKQ